MRSVQKPRLENWSAHFRLRGYSNFVLLERQWEALRLSLTSLVTPETHIPEANT